MTITDSRPRPPKHGVDRLASKNAGREVLVALRRIIRATDLHSKRLLKISGLTTPQVIVLQSIRDLGEVNAGQISAHVSLSQGTVTSILDRLEKHGLIERYRSLTDRRVVHARLTAAGRTVLRKGPALLHERFIEAFEGLSRSRQNEIMTTLNEVAEMMGAGNLDAAPLLDIATPRSGGRPRLSGSKRR
jgi:DNA-binding MarR family transcriptional regulator